MRTRRPGPTCFITVSPFASAGSEFHLCSGILGPPASYRDRLEAGGPRPCALPQSNLSETALGGFLAILPRPSRALVSGGALLPQLPLVQPPQQADGGPLQRH